MKWEDYYDRFWAWAESTKISRISSLTDFTSSAEVVEIANWRNGGYNFMANSKSSIRKNIADRLS